MLQISVQFLNTPPTHINIFLMHGAVCVCSQMINDNDCCADSIEKKHGAHAHVEEICNVHNVPDKVSFL